MPPRPAGEPYEPWSPRTRQFEVAGEWYRQDNLRRYFGGAGKLSTEGAEMDSDAQLVPDPMNPYDSNAVAVYVRGWHLGYLEREDALRYHSAIAGIQARGDLATVRSRQWARLGYGGEVSARVTVALPDPEGFDPANNLPEVQHVVLPTGSTIQVTKEDEHMDVLIRCLADYGSESSVAATLHSITEIRPRSAVDAIEVRIDGERVGILTPTQTANLKPLVDFLDERGIIPVSKATLKGNALKADVMLHVVKAQDVDEAWINHFSKINQVPRGATRLRPAFEWDDEDLGQPAQSSISAAPTVAETDAERVSAGWYPVDATTQRYWDGRAWTEHTAPR